ncbi:unnamed protein product [marine sediment metagenome]|uniref:Uncharacterized protein n=1 Tax=marine sediment metagenome TaxID=412755 RepID=X1CBX0_9ZZZZ
MTNQTTLFNQQPQILLNLSVDKRDKLRLSKQARKIYKLLTARRVSNSEMAQIALKYTGRVSEIRQALERIGQTVRAERGKGGLWYYKIVNLEN